MKNIGDNIRKQLEFARKLPRVKPIAVIRHLNQKLGLPPPPRLPSLEDLQVKAGPAPEEQNKLGLQQNGEMSISFLIIDPSTKKVLNTRRMDTITIGNFNSPDVSFDICTASNLSPTFENESVLMPGIHYATLYVKEEGVEIKNEGHAIYVIRVPDDNNFDEEDMVKGYVEDTKIICPGEVIYIRPKLIAITYIGGKRFGEDVDDDRLQDFIADYVVKFLAQGSASQKQQDIGYANWSYSGEHEDEIACVPIPINTDNVGDRTKLTEVCFVELSRRDEEGMRFTVVHKASGCYEDLDLDFNWGLKQTFITDDGCIVTISETTNGRSRIEAEVDLSADAQQTYSLSEYPHEFEVDAVIFENDGMASSHDLGSGYCLQWMRSGDCEIGLKEFLYTIFFYRENEEGVYEKDYRYERNFTLGSGEQKTIAIDDCIRATIKATSKGTEIIQARNSQFKSLATDSKNCEPSYT